MNSWDSIGIISFAWTMYIYMPDEFAHKAEPIKAWLNCNWRKGNRVALPINQSRSIPRSVRVNARFKTYLPRENDAYFLLIQRSASVRYDWGRNRS